jgi:hypothetical protein
MLSDWSTGAIFSHRQAGQPSCAEETVSRRHRQCRTIQTILAQDRPGDILAVRRLYLHDLRRDISADQALPLSRECPRQVRT